jgi:hypothetical protein
MGDVMLSSVIERQVLNSLRNGDKGKVISNQVAILSGTTSGLQNDTLTATEKQKRKAAVAILSNWKLVYELTDSDKTIISNNLQPSDGNNQLRKTVGLPELGAGGRRRKTHKRRKSYRRKSRKN